MSLLFIDTSALAKRYLGETGSAWIRAQVAPAEGNVVIISAITTIEMASLLARRIREGALSRPGAATLEDAFRLHASEEYLIAPLDGRVLDAARARVARHPLRTLDAN